MTTRAKTSHSLQPSMGSADPGSLRPDAGRVSVTCRNSWNNCIKLSDLGTTAEIQTEHITTGLNGITFTRLNAVIPANGFVVFVKQ